MKHANGREVGERRKQHSGRNNIRAGAWSIMSSLFCLLGEALMLSFVHQAGSNTINSFAGPFIAFGHTFEPCPSDGSAMASIRASHFNPVKPFDRQMLTGYMSANFNISDNLLFPQLRLLCVARPAARHVPHRGQAYRSEHGQEGAMRHTGRLLRLEERISELDVS
ncbi:uncharacterized protein LOC117643713 isoform X3 [Thrips palmi]|uniref:Uncharacterized protein LOC117643713 isoform X3 n=1 Tax=Thrips palmi TaxID=161013 RepID=A0A6P8YN87_THRPL|nr:uncharacterized protein LOC117643713 isoform X3 [Thrips palmi]